MKSKQKKGQDQEASFPLLSSQVTGILLLMLEDDSMNVRIAGIKAISHFAKQVKDVRKQCLNFLIDMLNDEIDEVRIGALHGISNFNEILALNVFSLIIN
jgi:integrator complex subunit 4